MSLPVVIPSATNVLSAEARNVRTYCERWVHAFAKSDGHLDQRGELFVEQTVLEVLTRIIAIFGHTTRNLITQCIQESGQKVCL